MNSPILTQTIGQIPGTRPILISGVYRSGTTFLTAVLHQLPGIAAASSTVKYLRFCLPYHPEISDPKCLRALLEEIEQRIRTRWEVSLDVDAVEAALAGQEISHARVYDTVMSELLLKESAGKTRWAEKLAMQWRDIPTFLEMFPDGQVIHVFRDPRDVTASYKEMTYEPWPTFLDAALNCKAAMIEVPEFQRRHGKGRILILRAEDLAQDLSGEMERICLFLGENFDSELADVRSFSDIKGEDWRTNTSFEQGTPNYIRAEARWTKFLSPEELFLIELLCQPHMADLGYSGSGQDPTKLSGDALTALFSDPWMADRLRTYLSTGLPHQGYRSDPYRTEMDIVFGNGRT